MLIQYDYCIVGAGPTGLTLGWILSNFGKKVIIVDRENSIGGCHRVRRVNKAFTEHGPRVYSNIYLNAIKIMEEMGIKFDNFFTPYKFGLTSIGGRSIQDMKLYEMLWFGIELVRFFFYPKYSKGVSCLDFMKERGFSSKTIDYIDRVCRLTDGAGADRYTLFEFLNNVDQNMLYNLYQPKKPNDLGIFRIMKQELDNKGVKFIMGYNVEKLESNGDKINSVVTLNGKINAKNFILAVPPVNLVNILGKSKDKIRNSFGDYNYINYWSMMTNYNPYITVIFHWDKKLDLPKIWGFPLSDWGVAFIVLTDYMKFEKPFSKTVISCCITKHDVKSSFTGKTLNQTDKNGVIKEVFRELKVAFPNLPEPTKSLLSPGDSINAKTKKWTTNDDAFLQTPIVAKGYPIDLQSKVFKNLYSVGTHSGYTKYHFTSMESAVTNGIKLAHLLVPDSKNRYPIKSPYSLLNIIAILVLTIILIIIFVLYRIYG